MSDARSPDEVVDGAAPRWMVFRDKHLNRSFSLASHLAKTLGVAAVVLALGLWLARDATWQHWLALPLFWAIANFFEWGIHRYPMHHPMFPRILYTNHAILHHRAFEGHSMEIRSLEDLSLVMMPWYTLVFVFLMASPIAVVAGLIGGTTLAGVFLIAAIGYFLIYEIFHTLHHLPVGARAQLDWIPGLRFTRDHHAHHHRLDRMVDVNFNVTPPLADFVLGTSEPPDLTDRA